MDRPKLEWTLILIVLGYLIGLQFYCEGVSNKTHQAELTIEKCEYEVEGYTRIVFSPSIGTPYNENLRFRGKHEFNPNSTYLIEYKINYDHRWRMKDCVFLLNYWKVEA